MKLHVPLKLKDAAEYLNIRYIGNPEMIITGINEIHKVENGDLTFVDIQKYYDKALNSKASFIIINKEVICPENKGLLISNEPFRDYNRLVNKYKIKETFYTESFENINSIQIGKNTEIHRNVVIANDVKIGNNCIIFPGTVLYSNTIIGDNVIIHANCVIGADAFYYKKFQTHFEKLVSCGRTLIEDDVEIGAACTIDKGVSGDTIIGRGSKLDNHIHIGHGVVIGERCLFAGQVGIGGKAIIGNEVMLWGQVGITKDVTIGDGTIVLAKSGVSKSLKGNTVYFGIPAIEANKAYKQLSCVRKLPDFFQNLEQ